MQPAPLSIRLPVGNPESPSNTDLYNASDHEAFGPSVISIHVGFDHVHHGLPPVPFTSLLDLGNQFPNLRALRLRCVVSTPDASQDALTTLPRLALLERLTIVPGPAQLPRDTLLTTSILSLLLHMPRLQDLTVYATLARPHYEDESGMSYPDAPLSLRRFVCVGGLSARACAHIIAHSMSTLEELKVDYSLIHGGADDARRVSAPAPAAPRLRVLDLRLDHTHALLSRFQPVALFRVQNLRLEVPMLLQDVLELLAGHASLRELNLWCTLFYRGRASPATEDFAAYLLRVPRLRSVTLQCFNFGNEDRSAMLEHCRARRIRCNITD